MRIGLVVVLGLLALAACASPTAAPAGQASPAAAENVIRVTAREYALEPAEITVPANKPVTLQLVNTGTRRHSLEVELPEDAGGEVVLEAEVPAGQTGMLTFTPVRPGEYEMYCPVGSHKDRGMVGKLIVTP